MQRFRERQRPLESFDGVVGQRAGEHTPQRLKIAAGKLAQRSSGLRSGSRYSPAPQHLVHQRREAEDIRAAIPGGSGGPFGRGVRSADGRCHADALESARHAEAGYPNLVLRDEHVTWMERAMVDAHGRGKVERSGKLDADAQRVGRQRLALVANNDVERILRHIVVREIRDAAFHSCGDRRGDARMSEPGGNQLLELGDELLHPLRRQAETEDFDGNEAISIGFVRTKHRTQCPCTDLMENPKRTERTRGGRASSIHAQWRTPPEGGFIVTPKR